MAFISPKDRVLEHSTSNSQTVFTVTGALDTSFNAFSASMTVGDTTIGGVVEPGVAFKSGLLTYSGANQVTVTTAYDSKGTFSAGGVKEVFMGLPAASQLLPDGAQTFSDAQRSQMQANMAAAPFDAMAYNGMQVGGTCEVAQENGTTAVTLTASGSLQTKYITDGIMAHYRGSFVATAGQYDAFTNGIFNSISGVQKAIQVNVTTAEASLGANDELSLVLPNEGYRVARMNWGNGAGIAEPVSVGFWIKGHRAGTYSGSLRNSGKTRSQPFTFTIAADTPIWISLTNLIGDGNGTGWLRDNSVGLYVTICLAGGTSRVGTALTWGSADYSGATGTTNGVAATSDTFIISNILVVPGIQLPSAAYAYNAMRPFDQEYVLTQRYYQSIAPGVTGTEFIAGGMASATQGYYPIRFNGVMRATPTCSVSAASDWNNNPFVTGSTVQAGTSFQSAAVSPYGFRMGLTSASTSAPSPFGQLSILDAVNTSAKIIADARL
jgi:hypothetical protein